MLITNKRYGTNQYKCDKINDWKKIGVIHNDFDSLFETYFNTKECQHCSKPFKDTRDRQLDHDHETGLFRMIICHKCNTNDSYINYPNGYDKGVAKKKQYESTKHKYLERINCICGDTTNVKNINRHNKTNRHLKLMEVYMNNVD